MTAVVLFGFVQVLSGRGHHGYVFRLAVVICCALAGLHAGPAYAEKRVALIIGNATDNHIAGLPNVPNDAAGMAALFKAAQFDAVEVKHNLGVAELRRYYFVGFRLARTLW